MNRTGSQTKLNPPSRILRGLFRERSSESGMPGETYGSTPMRSDPGHVVYVSVGSRQRFGDNKMGKIALSALGLALVACLVYSAATEERHYAPYSTAQHKVMQAADTMELKLATKEIHHEVVAVATKGLPHSVQALASQLASTSKLQLDKVDCNKKYKLASTYEEVQLMSSERKQTGKTSKGDRTWYLDRQSVDCKNEPIVGFGLERGKFSIRNVVRSDGKIDCNDQIFGDVYYGKKKYCLCLLPGEGQTVNKCADQYGVCTCPAGIVRYGHYESDEIDYSFSCGLGGPFKDAVAAPTMAGEDAGGGDPVFMDRLNVNCGTGKVLSQFKYERDGDSKQRYSVKCVEPEVADALMCSAPRTTGWVNRNGIGEWQAGFEYVAPWCGANEVMQQFKLLAKTEGNNKMAYQYTCCKVKGDVGTIAAYNVLKKVFQHLLNKQNKELTAASGQNDALKKAYDDANKAYLDAASSLSVAETNAKTAKEALEYATQEFEKFQSVVASAQKEVDETIPKLTAEKNELNDEKPILSQLRTMIDGLVPGPAATKALTAITQLASSIFTPKPAHKAIGKQVKALQMSLASETTTGFDNVNTASLLAIIDSIIDGMNTRIGEIDRAIARINGELTAANVKKLADQTALVGLAEKKDKSTAQEASMRTEVSRLDGVKTAAKEAYDNYNPGYLTQKASSDKIIDILKIIMAKIDEAIAKCATPK